MNYTCEICNNKGYFSSGGHLWVCNRHPTIIYEALFEQPALGYKNIKELMLNESSNLQIVRVDISKNFRRLH